VPPDAFHRFMTSALVIGHMDAPRAHRQPPVPVHVPGPCPLGGKWQASPYGGERVVGACLHCQTCARTGKITPAVRQLVVALEEKHE
jgi:hypothetical protein